MVTAYCVKCKEKKTMNSPVIGRTSKGGYIAKGPCDCGCKMCAMMSEETAKAEVANGAEDNTSVIPEKKAA